jgi:hypothetical protein
LAALWKRFNASRDEILWYYRELVKAFRSKAENDDLLSSLVSQLESTVGAIEDLIAANERQAGLRVLPQHGTTIYLNGDIARLSHDLLDTAFNGNIPNIVQYVPVVNEATKQVSIYFSGASLPARAEKNWMTTFKSNEKAKSHLITVTGVLQRLNIPAGTLQAHTPPRLKTV